MEALILTAALLTADATVRESDEYAAWCESTLFGQPNWMSARRHLKWLRARKAWEPDINPDIDALIAEQEAVLSAYSLIDNARADACNRYYMNRLRELIGDEMYRAGRLPAPVTAMRRLEAMTCPD